MEIRRYFEFTNKENSKWNSCDPAEEVFRRKDNDYNTYIRKEKNI